MSGKLKCPISLLNLHNHLWGAASYTAFFMEYDKARTEEYLANTPFVNHGFNEEWHYENRIITTIFHSQIPVGMKLGAIIAGDIVIEKPMTVKTTKSSCKQTKLKLAH